jgi:hypothetical protein
MTDAGKLLSMQLYPLNGIVDLIVLPKYLTISYGQKFSGLELLQYPRINEFVDSNKKDFLCTINKYGFVDYAEYTGSDIVIP